jgi:VWFA-related protein
MLSRLAVATVSTLLILAPALPQQPDTTIRSSTRLVQVSVVVLDNHGNPITGLTKDDLAVSDEGHPQSISIFTAETPPRRFPPTRSPIASSSKVKTPVPSPSSFSTP